MRILIIITLVLFSIANGNAQLIRGTIVPDHKKAVFITQISKSDSMAAVRKTDSLAAVHKTDSLIRDSLATVYKNDSIRATKKKDTIGSTSVRAIPKFKDPVYGNPILKGLDTTNPGNSTPTTPIKSNQKGQYLKGLITATAGTKTVLKPKSADTVVILPKAIVPKETAITSTDPEAADTILPVVKKISPELIKKLSEPVNGKPVLSELDTNKLQQNKPPLVVKTALKGQLVKGLLMPGSGKAQVVQPATVDTVVPHKETIEKSDEAEQTEISNTGKLSYATAQKLKEPLYGPPSLSGLDTTNLNAVNNYEPVKANLKGQYIKGVLLPEAGKKIIQPSEPEKPKQLNLQKYATINNAVNPVELIDTTGKGIPDLRNKDYKLPNHPEQDVAQPLGTITKPIYPVSTVNDPSLFPPERDMSKDAPIISGPVKTTTDNSLFPPEIQSDNSYKAPLKRASINTSLFPPEQDTAKVPDLDTSNDKLPKPVRTVFKGQYLKGSIIPKTGASVLLKPVSIDSLQVTAVQKNREQSKATISPLDLLDTTAIQYKPIEQDVVSKYGLPQQQADVKKPRILSSGIINPEPGKSVTIVPISQDSLNRKLESEQNQFPLFPPEREPQKDSTIATDSSSLHTASPTGGKVFNPLDALDTTKMVYDPSVRISESTLPPSQYKHQMITGIITPQKGEAVMVDPINKDTLIARNRALYGPDSVKTDENALITDDVNYDTRYNAHNSVKPAKKKRLEDTEEYATDDSNPDTKSGNMKVMASSPGNTAAGVKTNFIVSQFGKLTVKFATDKFYLTISQSGKVVDYDILTNGKVVTNANNKIVRVGNTRVTYNLDGSISSIADIPVTYTYDGKVNRVGDAIVSYTNDGIMEMITGIPIYYNANNCVQRISTYRVGYNSKQMVVGIDDSNGLVVFKPQVDNK